MTSVRSITKNIAYVAAESLPYRKRYGTLRGLKLWYCARKSYKSRPGELYSIRAPDLPAEIWLRAGSSDLMVFQQVICSGETDFDLGTQPRLAIDAGANIGLSSIVIAARYPNCTVVALEVDDENFAMLCKNTAPYRNIIPKKQALWSETGFVKISNPDAEAWAFQVVKSEATEKGAIAATTVDQIANEAGFQSIDLLKVDIEGGEYELFRNGPPVWLSSVKTLAVELHDRFRPGCTAALEAAVASSLFVEHVQGEYRVFRMSP